VVSLFAAMFPVGALADISNSGTLFAFFVVALGVMLLRRSDPGRKRSFKTPMIWLVGPLAMAGCALLFISLGTYTISLFLGWAVIGVIVYFAYGRSRSHLALGTTHLDDNDPKLPPAPKFHEGPDPGP